MALYSFIGIAVTSATLIIFDRAIWDPVELLSKFDSFEVVMVSMIGLAIATLTTNIAANVVAPANGFANIAPRYISFRMGGLITGVIGILMFPWKLVADPAGYIFTWLIAYSALLGSLAGIMICDYYLVHKRKIDISELFKVDGKYRGWNLPDWISFVIIISVILPGFLVQIGLLSRDSISAWLNELYSYAWFVSFFIAFTSYAVLSRKLAKN